ncbi:MAG: hypothetical protein ACLUSV_02475, partial [Streptococcus sp.]
MQVYLVYIDCIKELKDIEAFCRELFRYLELFEQTSRISKVSSYYLYQTTAKILREKPYCSIRKNLVRLSSNTIQTVSKINKNVIKPVANFTINKISKPVYNSIRTVAKPIVQVVNNTVVKPVGKVVYNNISKPVYNRIVKPVSGFVNRKVIKPVYNNIVKSTLEEDKSNVLN